MIHQPDEWQIVLWLNQNHVLNMTQNTIYRLANVGVQVYGIDNLYILISRGNFRQCMADLLKAATKAFPTMTGYQDHLLIRIQERIALSQFSAQYFISEYTIANPDQRINNRVPRDKNTVIRNGFTQQVLA